MIKLLSTNFELRTLSGLSFTPTSFSGSEKGLGTETGMELGKGSH